MKKLKMALSLILSAIVIFSSIAIGGMFASAETVSGTCGAEIGGGNLTWTFDTATGELIISGKGAMAGYNGMTAPWYSYKDKITEVTIEDGVTTIGGGAFFGCPGLTSILIVKSIKNIGAASFSACTSLKTITVSEENENYTSVNGILFNKEITEIICYPAGKEETTFTIPNTVTKICETSFVGCYKLTNITIPDSVTSIGAVAFYGCTGLTSVTIPNSVTSIGQDAFSGCNKLSDVYFKGTESQWNKISIGTDNDKLTSAAKHFYCDDKHTFSNGACENCWFVCDHTENTNKFICTEDYICSVCKKKLSPATTHSFDANGKCTKAECGYVCDHAASTSKATCEKSAVCSVCKKELPKLGHDFSGNPTETKATFFKDGSKVYHCTHDGCTETRTEITLSTINRILAWFRNIFSFKF